MNPSSPSVAEYTARGPYAVGPKEPLDNARRLMDKYGLLDLPVRAGGKLVGLLSARELRLVWALVHPPPGALTVEDAMAPDPYVVAPGTPLDEVVRIDGRAARRCRHRAGRRAGLRRLRFGRRDAGARRRARGTARACRPANAVDACTVTTARARPTAR